jgi:hypothetical protein
MGAQQVCPTDNYEVMASFVASWKPKKALDHWMRIWLILLGESDLF